MASGIDKCITDTATELGLPEERVRGIAEQLQAARADLEGKGSGPRVEADLRAFAKDKAERLRGEAMRTRKGAAEDVRRLAKNMAHWREHAGKGIADEDIAVARNVGDARMPDSAWLDRTTMFTKLLGEDFSAAMHKRAPVFFEMVRKPDAEARPFFDDVAREWAEIGKKGGQEGVTKNKDALEIARVLKEAHEASQIEKRRAGVNVGTTGGASMPHRAHEGRMMQAGETQWVKDAVDALDLAKMFPGTPLFGPEAREIVHLLRGEFYARTTGRDAAEALIARGGLSELSANLKKRLEEQRVWHWKSADHWMRFNEKYGRGHVVDGVLHEIENAARSVSLIDKYGSNPEAGYRLWLAHVQREIGKAAERGEIAPEAANARIKSLAFEGRIKDAWDLVSGRADIPSDAEWNLLGHKVKAADAMLTVRQYVTLAKLPSAFLSQFSDLATFSSALSDAGMSKFAAHTKSLEALFVGVDKEVAEGLGVTADAFTRDIHNRFSADDLKPGLMSRAIEAMYKWSGVRWWTDRMERGFAVMQSWWMAKQAAMGWDAIEPGMRHLLGRHGIDAKGWETIRAEGVQEINGKRYVMPSGIKDHDLAMKVRGFFADEAHYGMIKGDDRTRLFGYQGTRAGTVKGEIARTMFQFSSFSTAYGQRVLQRQLRGFAGADPSKGLIRSAFGQGVTKNGLALANVVVASTVYGWLSMNAKDWSKNRTMKDPRDWKTWLAAMAQGGGLGIYGDFLFGEADRNGGGLAQKLAGPVPGTAGDLLTLALKARNRLLHPEEAPGPDDVKAADFVRFFRNNNPVFPVNLWYTKALFDITVMNGLEEWASPGAFAKRAANLKRDFGQKYLVSPLIAQGKYSPRGAWK